MNQEAVLPFVTQNLKRYWVPLLCGFLASCCYGIIDGTLIWMVKPLMDKGFIAQDQRFISKIPIYLLAIFFLRSLVTYSAQYFLAKVSAEMASRLKINFFQRLLKYPAHVYDQKTSSEFICKINDHSLLMANSTTELINLLAREALTIIALLTVMFMASPIFSAIYLLSVPLVIAILSYATRRSLVMQRKVHRSSEEIEHHLQEVIEGHFVVKSFLGYNIEQEKFAGSVDKNLNARLSEAHIIARGSAFVQFIGGMVIAVILFLAQSPFSKLSGGEFACLMTAILALLRPLKQLSSVSDLFQKVLASAESLLSLNKIPQERLQGRTHPLSQMTPASVQFINVNFSYGGEKESVSLRDINFSLKPGQTVALVGPSGGGKSTLASLIPRFYQAEGKILLNGRNIQEMSLEDLRQHIALVSQQITLFNDSVAANIAYGSYDIDWMQLKKAAQLAFAEDFINDLPQGFLTKIGPGGYRLSGGERQRLALARSFYKRASLIILDEATSALDAESEDQIQRALISLMAQSSTLVIAHRLSTIMHAHNILVLDKGMIVEHGTHAELLKAQGLYAQLYQQSAGESSLTLSETP